MFKISQKWLLFAFLTASLAFSDKVFATATPDAIFDSYFLNNGVITIKAHHNPESVYSDYIKIWGSPDDPYSNWGIYTTFNFYEYYFRGFNTAILASNDAIITIIPKEFLQYPSTILASSDTGLTYSQMSPYLGGVAKTLYGFVGRGQIIGGSYFEGQFNSAPGYGDKVNKIDYGTDNAITSPYITISSPDSGSTLTSSADSLIGNYFYIDPTIYSGFLMNFRDNKLHASTNSYDFKFATSDTGTGNFTIPLSYFDFATNGQWDLHALAYGKSLSIQDELFLTTQGYIDVFSNELVDPAYNLIFNVSGWEAPFAFDNWDTWYGNNVSDYASPSDLATTFAGYLQPYFEKIGGFGSQANLYFNINEAYDRGFGLGSIFPMIEAYNNKVDMFFGFFPLASFFKYLIYTMIAIFIIRTILKFIPGLG